jgi:histidyl-tRNA synthetase
MSLSKNPYKGTRDFFPAEKRVQEYIFNIMHSTAKSFGYEPYDGPLLEEVELYKAKSGEELINDQIYSFTDRGKRFVAIRPEMTPTLARMVAQVHREVPKPLRWYSIPNLMRYEKPQKGRLREHWQLNCDIFGAPEGMGEIEIFQVLIKLFENFGATEEQFEIMINDRRIVDEFITQLLQLSPEAAYKLYKIIDRSKKISEIELDKAIAELDLDTQKISALKEYLQIQGFDALFSFLEKFNLTQGLELFRNFVKTLESLDMIRYVKYDATVVRGLDYYTGVVFEVFDKHPENRRALCGGGAYANLLKIFNEPALAGIGFGLGDVTLKDFLTVHKLLPDLSKPEIDLFITFQIDEAAAFSLKTAKMIRDLGKLRVLTQLSPIKINKAFPLATAKGARFIGLIGEEELKSQSIQIKNMQTKEQSTLSLESLEALSSDLSKAGVLSL